MRKIGLKSIALSALCALAVVSCNKEYDIKGGGDNGNGSGNGGIDPTITILPETTIGVSKSVDLVVNEFVPKDYKRIFTDDAGDYYIECHATGSIDTLLTRSEFDAAGQIAIPAEFKLPYDLLPDFIDGQLNLHCPIILEVENPTEDEMRLSAQFRSGFKSASVSDIPVSAGKSRITIESDDVKAMLLPFSDDIFISEVVLSSVDPAVPCSASADELEFAVDVFMPLQFAAGDFIEFTYGADLFKEVKINDYLDANKIDSKKMEIEIGVDNEVPFELVVSAKPGDTGVTGTLSLDKPVAAGELGSPAHTDAVLTTNFTGGLRDIYNIKLAVKATVPASTAGFVTLNEDQKVVVTVKNIVVKDGVKISK